MDLHSFQPTAQDVMKIAICDAFFYVGGESDGWVDDALQESVNPDMVVLSLLDAMGGDVKTEEIVEGMEHEHDHDHDEEHDHDDEHDHDEEIDEHVWLSLRNAQKLVCALAEALGEADPDHAGAYRTNAEAYAAKLADLDARYEEAIRAAAHHTILFGDRFPFRYLADDYGLDYYAAFSGCSAECEASFQTIIFLSRKVDELRLPAVLTIENPKTRIAETVVDNTAEKNQKILSLDSMQGVTAAGVEAGVTYLSVMEENLRILTEALN